MADKQTKKVMSEDLAKEEFYSFIKRYRKKPGDIEDVSGAYEACIDALIEGNLHIDSDGVPSYTLIEPVKKESGEVLYDKITFKTRISPNTQSSLAKGIDLERDGARYSLVVISHLIGVASTKELDLFHKFDYEVIRQLSMVFM